MKVILIQKVDNLGERYDLKEVSDGYARNFLIPKGLAKIATKEALAWLDTQKEIMERQTEEELKKSQELASKIDGFELVITVKVGEKGQLFEKITAAKIVEKLKENGFDVAKEQIGLEAPIEETGEYPLKVNLEHNLEAEINVLVSEEE